MSAFRHDQSTNAVVKIWYTRWGKFGSRASVQLRPNSAPIRQNGVASLLRAPKSCVEKRPWPYTRVSGLFWEASFRRWLSALLRSRAIKVHWQTKPRGKPRPGAFFSVSRDGLSHPRLTDIRVAGLGAGVTEAVMVVTPMEVVKIRLQAQMHSLADPLEVPKYRNAAHAVYTIVREEGFAALYRGISLTALRQATNQGKAISPRNDFYLHPVFVQEQILPPTKS